MLLMKNKVAVVGAGVVLAFSSVIATGSAASAAPAGESAATSAPASCVKIKKYTNDQGYRSFEVTNKCTETKRVRAIFKRAYDSSCVAIAPDKVKNFVPNVPIADWDRVVSC
ncbi:hypothetical protein NX801_16905 [Streptomyces sp. LP05-1]|uniref:Uncharacterized protein n=1 Tax=Streptomyces pyxinae TaxID=2970734 RepID=A0ABT2CIS9_9ACTN|nr:hypothetical protein [Streptomyces sp. LP05-1]MCS0637313.1 hypothetical protein [Streptomyces sp. LP05-1]